MRYFKKIKRRESKRWFAWYPVWAFDDNNESGKERLGLVWLEYINLEPYEHVSGYRKSVIKD
jgi:hypothetical protein